MFRRAPGGPLVDALGPRSQPIAFEVFFGSVIEVEGESARSLAGAVDAFWGWLHVTRSRDAVGEILSDERAPGCGREAALRLLRYAATDGAKTGV